MKRILVISDCPRRGESVGLTGLLLRLLTRLEKTEYQISLFDTMVYGEEHYPNQYAASHYYGIKKSFITKALCKIPKFRSLYAKWLVIKTFKGIVRKNIYDGIILHQLPSNAKELIKIAHKYGAKVVVDPWGSEVLRAKNQQRVKEALNQADFVIGNEGSNLLMAFRKDYEIPENKIIKRSINLGGIKKLIEVRNKLSREEMENEVGIPNSTYNIICGYNGYIGQRHKAIIDAIARNYDVLPQGYQLVFPITYGASKGYIDELRDYCQSLNLNSYFLTQFMTDTQIAYLHLVTDLFIQIQPTDNGNAFMIESLFAENQIVTGKWLNYNCFEQFGTPYYLIDSVDELYGKLKSIFIKELPKPIIPEQLISIYTPKPEYDAIVFWKTLFDTL